MTGARRSQRGRGATVVLAALGVAAGCLSVAAPAPGATPEPPKAALFTVACPTAMTCLALGRTGYSGPVIGGRSNGTTWSLLSPPSPKGGGLFRMACASAASCVAVGTAGGSYPSPRLPLMERWNGKQWSVVAVPKPSGAKEAWLTGVSCRGLKFCMVTGNYSQRIGGEGIPFSLRWNGSKWTIVAMAPRPKYTFFRVTTVSCAAATYCFAVGKRTVTNGESTLTERWNGSKWTIVPSPRPAEIVHTSNDTLLVDVSCPTTAFCFSVGFFLMSDPLGFSLRPYALRWNGRAWSRLKIPLPPGQGEAEATGVSCVSRAFCVTAGFGDTTDGSTPWTTKWNGTSWATVANPDVGNSSGLGQVSCVNPTVCVAVGLFVPVSESDPRWLVERFNGTSWSLDPPPVS